MHLPVLKKEVIRWLNPERNENFIDATIGEGGHALEILKKNGPSGKLLGIDRNEKVLKIARKRLKKFSKRLILKVGNFAHLKKLKREGGLKKIDGILFDLGLSSWHLEKSKRGFSFKKNEPLDMRYGKGPLTAEKILNTWQKEKIEMILRNYGGEKKAKKIAEKIVKVRKDIPLKTTFQLNEIIKEVIRKRGRLHPATKTYLALRIAVNNEFENLKKGLKEAIEILSPGGRLVVISYHFKEEKLVKEFFKKKEKEGKLINFSKNPIVPSLKEIRKNPRARSAKLRWLIKK